ncbi:MAG TPA: ABC transporter permease [Candidatus Pullichristensenella stercoripullorum]|nr:ABC transporter permease [Candidatus Pullichristensenella stercoripullorum]
MRKLFYARLALDNIRKNARTYIPYILSCVFTVAMTYILYMLPEDPGLTGTRGEITIRSTLVLGSFVVTIFAVIFLFYTSSFLTKRRRKEFGLLNVLGMEKKHLAKMMFFETLFVGLFSAVVGLALGAALSKLVLLFLLKLLDFDVAFGLTFSLKAALITLFIFAAIFLLILLNNIRLVHFASPVELLRGDKVGEREPKAKWLLVLIGVVTLGSGYLMAVTIQNPLEALMFFFVAVVLVIIGTYCLFTAGSIAVLKLLKRNRHYYYQPEHFISVSGMMYRMKQNAVGLGNICILSTMVLVMLSATSTMFIGTESSLMGRYPREIAVQDWDLERRDDVNAVIDDWLADNGWTAENRIDYVKEEFSGLLRDGKMIFDYTSDFNSGELVTLSCVSLEDFNRLTGRNDVLEPDQIYLFPYDGDSIELLGMEFETLDPGDVDLMATFTGSYYGLYGDILTLVTPDMDTLEELDRRQREIYDTAASSIIHQVAFDIAEPVDFENIFRQDDLFSRLSEDAGVEGVRVYVREQERDYIYSMNGGLFFLGVFLGLLFIMATVLIMYYKQLSEGYDDKRNFSIMRKVGLEKAEIRRSVRSQVLIMFYLPLITACVHIAFAFPFIMRLLPLVGINDVGLFALCTLVSVAAFALIYAACYGLTARTYYRIVGSDD